MISRIVVVIRTSDLAAPGSISAKSGLPWRSGAYGTSSRSRINPCTRSFCVEPLRSASHFDGLSLSALTMGPYWGLSLLGTTMGASAASSAFVADDHAVDGSDCREKTALHASERCLAAPSLNSSAFVYVFSASSETRRSRHHGSHCAALTFQTECPKLNRLLTVSGPSSFGPTSRVDTLRYRSTKSSITSSSRSARKIESIHPLASGLTVISRVVAKSRASDRLARIQLRRIDSSCVRRWSGTPSFSMNGDLTPRRTDSGWNEDSTTVSLMSYGANLDKAPEATTLAATFVVGNSVRDGADMTLGAFPSPVEQSAATGAADASACGTAVSHQLPRVGHPTGEITLTMTSLFSGRHTESNRTHCGSGITVRCGTRSRGHLRRTTPAPCSANQSLTARTGTGESRSSL